MIVKAATETITVAFLMFFSVTRLLKMILWSSPRIYEYTFKTARKIVTVLTPPAVPIGEPPINISMYDITQEKSVMFSCGKEQKPAVLRVTDSKKLFITLSSRGMSPMVP